MTVQRDPPRVRLAIALAALACSSLACSLLVPSRATETSLPSPAPATPVPVISAFDGSDESFAIIHQALDADRAGVLTQASGALGSPEPATRFAAVYALALAVEAEEAELLRPALADPEVALRTIAAGSLVGLGVPDSLPVLIDALESDAPLPYMHPTRPVWMLADSALRAYIDIDFGIAPGQDQRSGLAAAWRNWWAANGDRLTWDGARWVVSP